LPRRRAQPEAQLQRAVFEHLRWRGKAGWQFWATPNAAKRSPRYGAELKRQGLTAGVGDISALSPDGKYHELELKTERGRLSPAQRVRLEAVAASGCRAEVAYGLDDALRKLTAWGAIR
jgi:hypothetical protein